MRKLIEIILTIFIFNSFCIAQEIDSLDIKIDIGVDSLYNLQLELKSKQGILSDCDFAIENARRDFKENLFTIHSNAFSGNCSYCAVLRQDYNINWRFTNDLFPDEYYRCYDSLMSKKLREKYKCEIFEISKLKADSLEKTEKWIRNAEYKGGQKEMLKFIISNLTIDSTDLDEIKTKLFIQVEIDSTGKVINPIIRKGISESIDRKVIEIIYKMPDWKPAYLYGKPIRQIYYIPINLDYQ
ncbi:hypothetical protein ES731_15385 [Psychroflexus gondwanensis]|jgi:hypothetical protein|uniref:energy transducer TonB n=1 Tax=Psychroflexus gondwanensis TaxID=251 RepID=UPI0011BE6D80|nr:energy transducer TonB [Psychroflexus gondwanensis]TXE15410.1 hypothetical protein ES731_15385 [Psychroflexus gondwanensis]